MKLIKEFIIKEIILLFIALAIIEVFIIYLLSKRTEIIYNETYKETIDKVINKTLEAFQKFEEFTKNYLARYLADLKLIAIHSILFNINSTEKVNLKNKDKNIYRATKEFLNTLYNSGRFINYEENPYVDDYEKEFENITDPNFLLNNMFDIRKHPELNSVGYYSPQNSELSDEEQVNIKNMISIFKSIFIKRFISKRKGLDYIFLIKKKCIFIRQKLIT